MAGLRSSVRTGDLSALYRGYDTTYLMRPETWAELAPTLHVFDRGFVNGLGALHFRGAEIPTLRGQIVSEGYFQTDPVDWPFSLNEMVELVLRLRDAGIPPVFAFVYDEFWMLGNLVCGLSREILGKEPAALPNVWIWCLRPAQDESGWAPHRDLGRSSLFPNGSPKILSYWIPLTDATPLNGCMYVVPADRDPTYGTEDEMSMRFGYQAIRALPAPAGSILCWNQAIVHWGAHTARRCLMPRISVGFEHQRSDVPPFSEPLLDPLALPTYFDRLILIARQFERYAKHYGSDPSLLALGDNLARAVLRYLDSGNPLR